MGILIGSRLSHRRGDEPRHFDDCGLRHVGHGELRHVGHGEPRHVGRAEPGRVGRVEPGQFGCGQRGHVGGDELRRVGCEEKDRLHGGRLAAAVVVLAFLASAAVPAVAGPLPLEGARDTMHLTDEPGNWFKSLATGTPVSVVDPGDRVDFRINDCCTDTRHTVTLLVKPSGSNVTMDQDSSQRGTLSATFDLPGVYLFVCKVHPYMTAIVAVRDAQGAIPEVTADMLPFIGHLGAPSLPASTVLSVVTTIAPADADKAAKWDIRGPSARVVPPVPGVGEVWVNTQFERVPGQNGSHGSPKPGTITVVDAASFTVEREIDGLGAAGMWNNPHNMWANFALDIVYNGNWFGKWINKIDRAGGQILDSVAVGEAPTHIITIPTPSSAQRGFLTIPLSADKTMVKLRDTPGGLQRVDEKATGAGRTHPHGHWLTCGRGDRAIVPNVFKGLGTAGSISILDTASGTVLKEFVQDPADPLRAVLHMPIAAGECHVDGVSKAYVAQAASGYVTVIDVDDLVITKNIPVTLTPDGRSGFGLLDTLQVPIQTPVSPDERYVATAVFALTTVPNAATGSADHVAIIDTATDEIVARVPTPGGTHGVNWGAKFGGGYYAYVTNQHSNVLTIIDPDPDGDGDAHDAAAVGTILLSNGSAGAGVTDGTGGQGVKPLPMTHDGWIQQTVALSGTGTLSNEVEGWLGLLTDAQRDPAGGHFNPGEASRAGTMTVAKGPGTSIDLRYSPACAATDHVLYSGSAGPAPMSAEPVWSVATCGLGTSGMAVVELGIPSPGRMSYFVIAGQNALHEGSYGRSSLGVERPEAVGLGTCDKPRALAETCR